MFIIIETLHDHLKSLRDSKPPVLGTRGPTDRSHDVSVYETCACRVSSRNFILGAPGGKLTDHVAVRPQRGEGRLHILGGKLGQFWGEVELFGGEASPAPPSLDETRAWLVSL